MPLCRAYWSRNWCVYRHLFPCRQIKHFICRVGELFSLSIFRSKNLSTSVINNVFTSRSQHCRLLLLDLHTAIVMVNYSQKLVLVATLAKLLYIEPFGCIIQNNQVFTARDSVRLTYLLWTRITLPIEHSRHFLRSRLIRRGSYTSHTVHVSGGCPLVGNERASQVLIWLVCLSVNALILLQEKWCLITIFQILIIYPRNWGLPILYPPWCNCALCNVLC